MSERDCPDERAVLWAEHKERIARSKLFAHPDCRDPAHPGCSQCREDRGGMMEVGDIICERCHGSGESTCLSGGGPGAYDVPCECPGCGGTGVLKTWDEQLTDAYAEGRKDECEEFAKLLPGTYYMDPPDGGSVTVLEQFERMADDAKMWRDQQERIRLALACEIRCEG